MDEPTARAVNLLTALQDEALLDTPIDVEVLEVREATDALDTWFEASDVDWTQSGHRFVQVAQDGTGSFFCLWHYPALEGAPAVVFIGSEGELRVVADDAADFVRQLAMSCVFLGDGWVPPGKKDQEQLDFPALRARVEGELGPWSETADELQARGVRRHPDFAAWVAETSGAEVM